MIAPAEVPDFVDWSEPVNWAHPLNRGLVSWWLAVPGYAGYGSTVWRDLANRNHGTLTSMDPKTDWGGAKGRSGGWGSLDFDGSNDYVSIPDSQLPSGAASRSFSIWFNTSTSLASGNYRWAIAYGTNSIGQHVFIGFGSDTLFGSNGFGVSQYGNSVAVAGYNDAKWHHGVVVFSNGIWSVFVDGNLRASKAMTTNTVTNGAASLGRWPNNATQYWLGMMDAVVIHNRALSAAEVLELYQQSLHHYPDLLSRVPMRKWFVPQGFNPAWAAGSNVLISYW